MVRRTEHARELSESARTILEHYKGAFDGILVISLVKQPLGKPLVELGARVDEKLSDVDITAALLDAALQFGQDAG